MRNMKFWKQISIIVAILGLFLMKGECSADTNWAASANGATIGELSNVQGDPYQSIQNVIDGGRFTLYYREYHGNYPFDFTATAYYTLEITPPQTITTLNNIKYWVDWVCGVDTVDGGWASELNKTVSVMVKQGASWTEVGTDTSVGGVTLTGPWQNVDAIRIYLAGSRDVWHRPSGAEVEAWVRVSCYELEAWGVAGSPPPDTTPPTGTISIHGDAQYANSTSVMLTLTAQDSESGVSKMKLSNDGTNWTPEEDYVHNIGWTLTSGDGTKTVYVQYKDNAGNWSSSISDTIVLETTLPTGTISINNGAEYTNTTSVTLNLSASDTGSGVSKMMFSNDGTIWTGEENYAMSKSWTLTSGDGTKTVYVRYKDNAGNWSNNINDTIILDTTPQDTTPPTGTISINNGAQYTTSTSVILNLSASDSGSGVGSMRFKNEGGSWSSEETYATTKSWTLTSGDGTKTVYVQYKDNAGNWSSDISDTIILDMIAPTGTISINNGAQYTTSTSVTLNLSASDSGSGVSKMMFSNDGTIWTGEENYAMSKSWTLTSGDGTKTVYVRYKDNAGNWSNSISDTIILDTTPQDTTPPTGTISINNGAQYTTSTSVMLNLSASDSGSGVSSMRFRNEGGSWSSEEQYATTKAWTLTSGDGTKTVYVQYKDNAGNWSSDISDTIILDMIVPTGTISINNGAQYTTSTSVTLNLSASDSGSGVSSMRFRNEGGSWSSEETYATTKSWTLTSGDGTKTVYVQYKDNAGNWSNSISDTIVLDTIVPTGTISINSGAGSTNSPSVTLTLSANDSGSGVSAMRFRNEGGSWSSEEQYATIKSWTLTSGDGTKTVYVQYKDGAGNWSGSISDTIILDTTAPGAPVNVDDGVDGWSGNNTPTFTWESPGDISAIAGYWWAVDDDTPETGGTWTTATTATTSPLSDGTHTFYVKAQNGCGLVGPAGSHICQIDATVPMGTISINNGAERTNSTSVTLSLWASTGVVKMKFRNEGEAWTPEEGFAETKSWTLPGGDGVKRVYVQYKNNTGNLSAVISDTIILDTQEPMVELVVEKARILPDGEVIGVIADTGMEARFSELMRITAVEKGLELIAEKDNLNRTINEKVPLKFDWVSSSETVKMNPESGELKKNYLYKVQVTNWVVDLAGNPVTGERELTFRIIMDHTRKNIIVKLVKKVVEESNGRLTVDWEENAVVSLEANALKEDGYLIINTEPLTYQMEVNPGAINAANEKSLTDGWYPVEGCLWEIKACKENGDWLKDNFDREVKISFPYDEGGSLKEETLMAFWLNEEHSNWVRVPGSGVDKESNVVVTGEVPNFSVFALMGTALYDLSEAHAYPVPWKPNDGKDETGTEEGGITFTNLAAECVIKIYTISGELVMKHEYKGGGNWTWDVKTSNKEKVFSGVYIYYIENEKGHKTGRLVIVR